ncbi:5'-3' exoribonuclease 2 [Dendrobium catenatum]|uniref:5'-3' exoribonuclease 2 n=1 Tax=Dendrobium catenatum TaxID=906689 RepID=A0A2I0XEV8_9ASPA|nr:5'-3' exoribonuclease 2 [Dendrobium catenatum]
MKNSTMQQYLANVKNLVDNIAASGSTIDAEDILIFILNGLPSTYNAFRSAIRTSQQPIDLDTLYSLLCSEEINLQTQQQKDLASSNDTMALFSNRTNSRSKTFYRNNKGKNASGRPTTPSYPQSTSQQPTSERPTCQICSKVGHSALNCWHRCNLKYAPTTSSTPQAMLSYNTNTPTSD